MINISINKATEIVKEMIDNGIIIDIETFTEIINELSIL